MNPRVKLSDIIDSISFQTYNTVYYLDKENGKLFPVSKDQLRAAKEDDAAEDYSEWQNEQIKLAREILVDDKEEKYIAITGKFVSHEYSTMENFCLAFEDKEISMLLFRAILGRGAFRRFSDCIHRYGIADDWYWYRFNAMKRIIIDWCEANNIDYVEK